MRRYFFTQRVVSLWNSLPQEVVDARTLNVFERQLDIGSEWANAWQMQYNVDKCEDIHFGSNNRKTDYYLNGCKLREVDTQQDLGIFVHQY